MFVCLFMYAHRPGDMTGEYSAYTIYEGHEIMFHVSTMLPYSKDNRQQVGADRRPPRAVSPPHQPSPFPTRLPAAPLPPTRRRPSRNILCCGQQKQYYYHDDDDDDPEINNNLTSRVKPRPRYTEQGWRAKN